MCPRVSIIVAIYNADLTLSRCIDSLLSQTFVDFEILLVDDGSTDSSYKICGDYAIKDCRIKVLHKANGGVSSANAVLLKDVGADILVAGSSVFGAADRKKAIDVLRS